MKDHSYAGRLALLTLPLALLIAVAVPAQAEQETAVVPVFEHATMISGAALEGTELGAGEGMRVAIDPKTGKLRQPSRAQVRALDRQQPQRRATRALAATQVERPDGTVMMAVDESLMNYSVGHAAGGSAAFACVEGTARADLHFLSLPAPAAEEK
jgi:hypothetical protein